MTTSIDSVTLTNSVVRQDAANHVSVALSNGVIIELLLDKGMLLGIGEVVCQGTLLRSNQVPICPDFSSLDGLHFQDFQFEEVGTEADGSVVIQSTAIGRPELIGNDLQDQHDFTLAFAKLRDTQRHRLDWIIKPVTLELDGETYQGFSLAFRFESEGCSVHRLTTQATWEIGGRATGNTIYHQSQVTAPVHKMTKESRFTSACLKRLDQLDSHMGYSYQMAPRWALMQPFEFLAAGEGVLMSYWPQPHAVKSLVQKNAGEDVLFILDEYRFPSATSFTTPEKHILFSASEQPRAQHEIANMWTRAMEYTGDSIRDQFGMKISPPRPNATPTFQGKWGVNHRDTLGTPGTDWRWEVGPDDRFYFLLEGQRIESRELLYWVADEMLPQYAEQGRRHFSLTQIPIHQSDFTEMGFARKADAGWHSDLHVSSVCGTHRYVPADMYDGWRGWRYLASKADKLGIFLGHWLGMNLTPNAPILHEHPEYALIHANTKAYSGGYGHNTLIAMNWNSGVRRWLLDDMVRWFDEGLRWVWIDSWSNIACLSADYVNDYAPMQPEAARIIGDLYRIGYRDFRFEGVSPFGTTGYGIVDPMHDYAGHVVEGVVGQNDFADRIGHEYMAWNEALDVHLNPKRTLDQRREWSFRYIANRSLNIASDTDVHTYNALYDRLDKRYLLPDDRGVLWKSEAGMALFAYKSFPHHVGGASVSRIDGRSEHPVDVSDGVLETTPWTAYRIGD